MFLSPAGRTGDVCCLSSGGLGYALFVVLQLLYWHEQSSSNPLGMLGLVFLVPAPFAGWLAVWVPLRVCEARKPEASTEFAWAAACWLGGLAWLWYCIGMLATG